MRAQKAILLVPITVVALIGSASLLVQKSIEAKKVREVEQSIRTVLDTTHQAMLSWMEQHRASVLAWANTAETRHAAKVLIGSSGSSESTVAVPARTRLRLWLSPVVQAHAYLGYALISAGGVTLAASNEDDIGDRALPPSQSDFLERVLADGTAFSMLQAEHRAATDSVAAALSVGASVKDSAGRAAAALVFRLDPSRDFTAILQQGRIGVTGETYAFDTAGRLISESRFEEQLRNIGLISTAERAALDLELRDPGADLTAGERELTHRREQPLTHMAHQAIAGISGVNTEGYRDYRGVLVVGAWLWDPNLGFGIATELDRNEAYATLDFSVRALTALTVFCSLLVVGLAVVYDLARRQSLGAGKRLRQIVDLVPNMILVEDQSGRVMLANKAAAGACGTTVESLQEAHAGDLSSRVTPASALFASRDDLSGSDQRMLSSEAYFCDARGKQRVVQRETIAYQSDDRKQGAVLTVATDITERKEMEVALRKSEEFARAVLRSLTAHVAVLDGQGEITAVNSTWERFARENGNPSSHGTGIGVNYLDVCRRATGQFAREAPLALAGIQSVIEGTAPGFTLEYPCHAPGQERWFLLTASPLAGARSGAVVSHMDITKRKQAEVELERHRNALEQLVEERSQELYQSERNLRSVVEGALGVILWLSPEGRIVGFNREAERLYGKKQEDVIGKCYADTLVPEADREAVSGVIENALEGSPTRNFEYSSITPDGGKRTLSWSLDRTLGPKGESTGVIAIGLDISDRKQAEERLQLAQKVFENTADAILVTDHNQRILEMNDALCTLTGYTRDELMGQKPKFLSSGRHDKQFYERLWKSLHERGQWRGEIWDRRKDGRVIPSLASISLVRNQDGEIRNYVAVFSDITSIKEAEQRLEYLAHFDQLTGVPNRTLFHDRLRAALARARRHGKQVAVLYIDLDSFKQVNDTFGHQGGDRLLAVTAERLRGCVREEDTVARLGGDEFAIILDNLDNTELAHSLTRRALDLLNTEITVDGKSVRVSASVGVAVYPVDGADAETILRHADNAMFDTKKSGKNGYRFFDPDTNARLAKRNRLESDLRSAISNETLFVQYQPKFDLSKRRVVGVEALVRWNHPEMGTIVPAQFIPLAEETGLIIPLGRFVMKQACQAVREWQKCRTLDLPVAVNLSARQFRQESMVEDIRYALTCTKLPPQMLHVELTESLLMEDVDRTVAVLNELRCMGVRIAIDDFGSGYSSLSYLKMLPVDVVKIDRSFVKDIPNDASDRAIVSAIISMAHSLDHKVVAEGVENAGQVEFLKGENCDEVQGFFISPPVSRVDLGNTIGKIENRQPGRSPARLVQ